MGLDNNSKIKQMPIKDVKKKKIVKETVSQVIDTTTGEILTEINSQTVLTDREPDYVKVYLDTICAIHGVSKALSPVLFQLCPFLTWADDEAQGRQLLSVNPYVKQLVAQRLQCTITHVNNSISKLKAAKILMPIAGSRGTYLVNPLVVGKGRWEDVRALRAEIDFKAIDDDGSIVLRTTADIHDDRSTDLRPCDTPDQEVQ